MPEISRKTNAPVELILSDYKIVIESREASLLGRKEVFMGKAKFGIFGDGKELAQIAMAKVFRNGDWRSGYYRDQTFMCAIGELSWQQFFAQLYAHTEVLADPSSAGRMMNNHFGTRLLDIKGGWKNHMKMKNSASDMSATCSNIPKVIGLGYASKLYRQNPALKGHTKFSHNGDEVVFATIGNGSCAEGVFFEAINASVVLQIPTIYSVWDDEYAISVPNKYQVGKSSVSRILEGFKRNEIEAGLEIFVVKGWDYPSLCKTYAEAAKLARTKHIPSLIHVTELTQPQGHSSSGSHERYKSKERLKWEEEHDCNAQFRLWILENGIANEEQLEKIEAKTRQHVKKIKNKAWGEFRYYIQKDHDQCSSLIGKIALESQKRDEVIKIKQDIDSSINPMRLDAFKAAKKVLRLVRLEEIASKFELQEWVDKSHHVNEDRYSSHLHSQSKEAAINIPVVDPVYSEDAKTVDGRKLLNANFYAIFHKDPRVFVFGEDVGKIGDVNKGVDGLQEKFGELRVTDTGIREATIIGQGVGAAMRGLRPIAEIQYLDYIYYSMQTLADDLSCLHYRTKGGQKAPLIVRTRGHRLEGIWHSGSPMGMMLGGLKGIYLCVPRNFTEAAGMYNTLLQGDDPAIIVEPLNAYRLKEKMPENPGDFTIPLGVPKIIREGTDMTIVTYGPMCRICMQAANELQELDISCEIIDVRTLMPFDLHNAIIRSVEKTNRVIFADEDMPGEASAFMMQQVLEKQNAYFQLDSKPVTISAKPHRPPYSSDGDYFSKPNVETIFDTVYEIMSETNPAKWPGIYS